jgi:hypothetical protein
MKYLGAPLHYKKPRREDLQPVVDKVIKKLVVGGGSCCHTRLKSF